MDKFIVVTGSPVSGLDFIGPFNTEEAAQANVDDLTDFYASRWVAPLLAPGGDEIQEGLTPAYPIGHVFWSMWENRAEAFTVYRVVTEQEEDGRIVHSYGAMRPKGRKINVDDKNMALTTKEMLLASL